MPDQQMSGSTMLLLGGGMTVGVAAVLGLTLVLGPAHAPVRRATEPAPVEQISAGAVAVPALVGLDSMAATGRLAARRLGVADVIRVPSSLPAGQVVRAYPRAGTPLPPGGQVTLYVSVGPDGPAASARVTVPYFTGMDAQQARGVAGQLGLLVTVQGSGTTVSGQSPAPGTVLPRGGTVRLDLR
ncbi:hypothetical protein DPM19_29470 [Actinomadura craniellae]|uniref:PASTA domain-containing protein n=1 Tax=Actinomadura craniellae TaxID=2231787 RepID=A0A365GY59_9ACTN|nr:PASTA domain-containing protein [Actinomadura craniellae]RAY11742.1 hypothetical protein DPM19_29470 [Actinomadura craniellae]